MPFGSLEPEMILFNGRHARLFPAARVACQVAEI